MSAKLGEILVRENLISPQHLRQALDYQREHGGRLGFNLVKLGLVSDDTITAVLSRQYGIPSVNLELFDIDDSVLRLIPQEVAQKYSVLPLSRVGATLTLAMVDPTNVFAMDDIKFMTGFNIEPVVASESAINDAIKKHYGSVEDVERKKEIEEIVSFIDEGGAESVELEAEDESSLNLAALEKAAEEAPVIKLVNYILTDAVKRGASDIHMEPYEKEFRVRFRIDGILQSIMTPPLKLKDAITSRLKIMAKLDIAEKRKPQDGKIRFKGPMGTIELRVATIPTSGGNEDVVMRILAASKPLPMHSRGFRGLCLGSQELRIRHFHKVLDGYLYPGGAPGKDDA
jgi:type IV pilus assembly protein PilB